MDKKVGKMVQEVMGEGEKKAPLKSMKLKVKFQKADEGADGKGGLDSKKKKIMKKAVESAKEEKDEEDAEKKDGMGGPSFGNNPGISKVGGGVGSLYKNLRKNK